MTVYIGVDFHARQQTISYLTTEDGEIKRLQLDHGQPEEVRRFLYLVSRGYYVFKLPRVAPKAEEEEQPVRS